MKGVCFIMKKRGMIWGLIASMMLSGCGTTANMKENEAGKYAESIYREAHPEEFADTAPETEVPIPVQEEAKESVAETKQEQTVVINTSTSAETVQETVQDITEEVAEQSDEEMIAEAVDQTVLIDAEEESVPLSAFQDETGEQVIKRTKCRANIRTQPDDTAKVYKSVAKNVELTVIADEGGWSTILFEDGTYYIASRLLKE